MAVNVSGRSPQGERGLKLNVSFEFLTPGRRSPQGERGLKLDSRGNSRLRGIVAPRKGSVD